MPTDAPRLVTAVAESPQRISMTWEQLSLDSVNGVLLGYKVLYKPLAGQSREYNRLFLASAETNLFLQIGHLNPM